VTTHLALVGPTASGKSSLAIDVALALGDVEIVSADSMQVYRGLDIGTAKPTQPERALVRHHLVDVVDPSDSWSVARYQAAARDAIADVERRGRRALLVGGTGLYVQAVIDDLRFPAESLDVRAGLEARVRTAEGLAEAYRELRRRDPMAAARIEPGNARRIVRALEAMQLTDRPFSSSGPGVRRSGGSSIAVSMAGVWLPRAVLSARIEERFDTMRAAGLVAEVRRLVHTTELSRTARQAIGYKEVMAFLEGTGPSLGAGLATAVRRTRALSRRQRMWFRRDPRITWFGTPEKPSSVLPALLALWSP
jgi:tRNA dimethylallyltransferase